MPAIHSPFRVTTAAFTAALAVVAATDLVTTIPASLLAVQGDALGVRALAGPAPPQKVKMTLCWHERTHADPAMVAFRDLVRHALTGR